MQSKEKKIKIYITCFNNKVQLPKNDLFELVEGGAANMQRHIPGLARDDEGDNISTKNPRFNDAATIYWAWKNRDNDYYGFMQYRRMLSFDEGLLPSSVYEKPYFTNDQKTCHEMRLDDPTHMRKVIGKYDVITCNYLQYDPIHYTLYQQYNDDPFQHEEDLCKVIEIIQKKYPEYMPAVREALFVHGRGYFANLFIMKKEYFWKFCEFMFDILLEFDAWRDYSEYNAVERRAPGFLSERLLTIYYTYLQMNTDCKFGQLQKCYFETTREYPLSWAFEEDTAVPVVLSSHKMFLPYTGVAVQSIIDNASNKRKYDIIILHENLTNAVINRFCSAQTKFNISIRFVNVSSYFAKEEFPVRGHFGKPTYYRMAIGDIMANYRKVIYLDSDLIVNTDIAELYDVDLEGKAVGAVQDADTAGLYNGYDPNRKSFANRYLRFEDPYDYFQAGVMVFDIPTFSRVTDRETLVKCAKACDWDLLDQDVLNLALHGNVKYLDMAWNVAVDWNGIRQRDIISQAPGYLREQYQAARMAPKIVHYLGPEKPWETPEMDFGELFWKYMGHSRLSSDIRARREMKKFSYIWEEEISRVQKIVHKGKKAAKTALPQGSFWRKAVQKMIGKGYQYRNSSQPSPIELMLDDQPLQNCGAKPAFDGNSIPIALMSSNEYLQYLSVTVQSILDHTAEWSNYDIIIFHEGLDKRKVDRILGMAGGRANVSIRFFNISNTIALLQGQPLPHYAKLIFCRVLLGYILYNYEKIIFVDSDILVRTDLAQCINFVGEKAMVAAANEWCYSDYGKTLGIEDSNMRALNAGFMVQNLSLFREKYTQGQLLSLCNARNWRYLDQDVLNIICDGYVRFLPYSWNYRIDYHHLGVLHLIECKNSTDYQNLEPQIIHYAGAAKPWLVKGLKYEDEFWEVAKRSPFSSDITVSMILGHTITPTPHPPLLLSTAHPARGFIDFFLPLGSRRRVFIKRLAWKLRGF